MMDPQIIQQRFVEEYVAKDSRFRYLRKENGDYHQLETYGIERAGRSFYHFCRFG